MNKKLRSFIIAPKGKLLIACDLSQAETWVVAYLAKEDGMKWALKNSDIHYETAIAIFEEPRELITKEKRYTAKRVNHGSSYRMTPPKFVQAYNADSEIPIVLEQARTWNGAWHNLYPNIKVWWNEIDYNLLQSRTMITPYGRSRTFYGQMNDELKKQATAHNPQSTVGDHFNGFIQYNGANVKGGLREVYKRFKEQKEVKIINQSHDSCMLEVPSNEAIDIVKEVKSILYRPIIINGEECCIPVDSEVGDSWGTLEKVK